MKQRNLFEDEVMEEGILNPFYDPDFAEAERLENERLEMEYQEAERKKQAQIEASGLEYQICCAHVSRVDGSAYAVSTLKGYEPKYIIYRDGLPDGVDPKRCTCNGKGDGWRGGELVNKMFDDDEEANT